MRTFANLTSALVVLGLTGCVATSPNWDASFGDAAKTLAAQQVISPDASLNPSPVTGVDGKAAQSAMGEYAKSYAQPKPQTGVFTIGVGGGSGR